MAKTKPVFVTELQPYGWNYYEPQLGTQCCRPGLMLVLQYFYDMPASPSRIWIEWYTKLVPGAITVTPDPYDSRGARIGRIQSGKRTHYCPHVAWRVLPDDVVEWHKTLYAKVYYQE